MLANLLTNAAKYSEPGSRIALRAERDGAQRAHQSSRTTASASRPTCSARVFEPFVQQPQSLDRAGGGLGLGLAIVRSLVELHGGSVRAESDGPDQGSRFIVELPARRGRRGSAAAPPAPPPHGARPRPRCWSSTTTATPPRCCGMALERLGYTVEVAYDGPSALAPRRRVPPRRRRCSTSACR